MGVMETETEMETVGQKVVAASALRGLFTSGGDLKEAIAFQNDVNALIAEVSRLDTVQETPALAAVAAPFGMLPARAAILGVRPLPQVGPALRSLVLSRQERDRRLRRASGPG
jgi:hypothetical protein